MPYTTITNAWINTREINLRSLRTAAVDSETFAARLEALAKMTKIAEDIAVKLNNHRTCSGSVFNRAKLIHDDAVRIVATLTKHIEALKNALPAVLPVGHPECDSMDYSHHHLDAVAVALASSVPYSDVPTKRARNSYGMTNPEIIADLSESESAALSLPADTSKMYDGTIDDIAVDFPIVPEWINTGLRQMTEQEQFEQANSELALTKGEIDAMFPTVGTVRPISAPMEALNRAVERAVASGSPIFINQPPELVTFPRSFGDGSGFVCDGDTIEVSAEGFDIVATIVRDDSEDSPDERGSGFWPSDDPKNDGYIGDGYKLTDDELAESFEFLDHGVEGSQYFQGCGTIGSDFEEVATGIGSSYREALNDAFEQACTSDDFHQSQIDAIEQAIAAESDTLTTHEGTADEESEVWHHASIRYNLASPIIKAKAQAQATMDAWKNNEWWYVGVSLSVSRSEIMLDSHAASLWGIECNYPTADGKMNNSHLTETANELVEEALAAGRAAMVRLNG